MTPPVFDSLAAQVALSMTVVGLVLAVVRLILGPSLPDRVVALDLISILVAAATAIYAFGTDQAIFVISFSAPDRQTVPAPSE